MDMFLAPLGLLSYSIFAPSSWNEYFAPGQHTAIIQPATAITVAFFSISVTGSICLSYLLFIFIKLLCYHCFDAVG